MTVSNKLKQAVAAGNLVHMRAIIIRQIVSDRKNTDFLSKESIEYAIKNGAEIFQADDGDSVFCANPSSWTDDLWDQLHVELIDNFSREKVDSLLEMICHLRAHGHPDFQIEIGTGTSSSEKKQPNQFSGRETSNRWWIVGGLGVLACAFLAYKAFTK